MINLKINIQHFKSRHCCSISKYEPGTFDISGTSSPLSAAKLSYWDSPTPALCHLQLNTKPVYGHYINTFSLQQRRYVTSAFPRSPTYRTRKFDRFLNPFYVIPLHSLTCLNFRDMFIHRTLK